MFTNEERVNKAPRPNFNTAHHIHKTLFTTVLIYTAYPMLIAAIVKAYCQPFTGTIVPYRRTSLYSAESSPIVQDC